MFSRSALRTVVSATAQLSSKLRRALPAKNPLALLGLRNVERFDRRDRVARSARGPARHRTARRWRTGNARAEEGMAAARRRDFAVERGVGIEHLEVVERRPLQAGVLGDRIALRRAEENLPEAKLDLAGEDTGSCRPCGGVMILSLGSSSNRPE